jgi:putative inorganic carbon (HCO3(-)) transporter
MQINPFASVRFYISQKSTIYVFLKPLLFMSKKHKAAKQRSESPAAPVQQAKKTSIKSSAGSSTMTNWIVVLVAILPFLISGKQIDPAVVNRFIWLAVVVLIFSVVFFLRYKKTLPAQLPLPLKVVFISGLAYTVWAIFSSVNAVNPNEGYYVISRHLLNMALLFIIVFTVIHEEKQFLKIAKALVIVGILQSFIGILQFYGSAFTEIPGNYIPYGLMANRNLFGSAEALLLPFGILVLAQRNKTWKYVAGSSLTLLAISVFISQTRSAWLASVLIGVVALVLICIFSPAQRKQWLIATGAGIIIFFVAFTFVLSTSSNDEFKKSVSGRVASFTGSSPDSSAEQQNVTERFKIWKKTIQLIKKDPILGVGPGNWRIAIPATGSENTSWETGVYVPDQPHNDYLHVASEAGIPGALFYFIPWIIIGLLGLQVVIKTKSDESRLLVICMLAGMAGFASDSMFSFPEERMEHSLYFSLMCGAILGAYYNFYTTERNKNIEIPKWISYSIPFIAAFAIFIGSKRYNFEVHLNRAMAYDKIGQHATVL